VRHQRERGKYPPTPGYLFFFFLRHNHDPRLRTHLSPRVTDTWGSEHAGLHVIATCSSPGRERERERVPGRTTGRPRPPHRTCSVSLSLTRNAISLTLSWLYKVEEGAALPTTTSSTAPRVASLRPPPPSQAHQSPWVPSRPFAHRPPLLLRLWIRSNADCFLFVFFLLPGSVPACRQD
jgi:hypothetical protein